MNSKSIIKEFEFEKYSVIISDPTAPTVHFVDGNADAMTTLTKLVNGYKGVYSIEYDPSLEDQELAVTDMLNTKLKTPMEMIYTVWLLNDVPRTFTHQMVRTRIGASFVQESMRFWGTKKEYKVMMPRYLFDTEFSKKITTSILDSVSIYHEMVESGIPSEDARGILPTDIMTNLYFGVALSTFSRMYEQRMCCQAQKGIWQPIMRSMRNTLSEIYGEEMGRLISAPYERGESCGYRASFERPCQWENKHV